MRTHASINYEKLEALKITFEVSRFPSRTLSEKLKERRLELGLKQVELADLLGVNENSIVKWEKGHARHLVDPVVLKCI